MRKAAKVGFDWPDVTGPLAKVDEELAELRAAIAGGDVAQVTDELGDLVVAVVNVARHAHVDAELAPCRAAAKFRRRFEEVEVRGRGAGHRPAGCLARRARLALGRGQGRRGLSPSASWSGYRLQGNHDPDRNVI